MIYPTTLTVAFHAYSTTGCNSPFSLHFKVSRQQAIFSTHPTLQLLSFCYFLHSDAAVILHCTAEYNTVWLHVLLGAIPLPESVWNSDRLHHGGCVTGSSVDDDWRRRRKNRSNHVDVSILLFLRFSAVTSRLSK